MRMRNCTYTLNETNYTYQELYNFLKESLKQGDLKNISDIVFSKAKLQESQKEVLDELVKNNIEYTKGNQTLIDGSPSLGDKLSVLQFINSDGFTFNGRRPITPFSAQDYIKQQSQILIDGGMSQEEALKQVQNEVKNWDKIQEDGLWLHKFVDTTLMWENDDSKFIDSLKDVPDRLNKIPLLLSLRNQIRNIWAQEKGRFVDPVVYRGLTIKSPIKGLHKELYGKIDWLFVGQDGVLHAYVFKTTSIEPKKWIDIKQQSYRQELAFLSQMLSNNGVNIRNIELNIVPIQLNYSEKYDAIQSIGIYQANPISTRSSSADYAMHKYERRA